MIHFPTGFWRLLLRVAALIGLTVGIAAGPVQARQVLLVANGNNTVGEYDATTGTTLNAAFINGQGLNGPGAMAVDASNHLFVRQLPRCHRRPVQRQHRCYRQRGFHLPSPGGDKLPRRGCARRQEPPVRGLNDYHRHGEPVRCHDGRHDPLLLYRRAGHHASHGDGARRKQPPLRGRLFNVGREFDATSAHTIDSTFISLGDNKSYGIASDGHNHLFVSRLDNTVGEYDTTTGAALQCRSLLTVRVSTNRSV